jgi:hypothetical protein
MNDFAARHSSLKQELEGVMQKAKENEKMLEKPGAELKQMRQVEPQKEMIADKDVGEGMSAASMEAAMDQKLTPLTVLLSSLTRKVEQMSEGNSVVDVAYGREQAVEGRNDHGTADRRAGVGTVGENSYVREVDCWGGTAIGEANRIYKDNLSAVVVTKTGDANFTSARACWDRLTVQYPVSPIHQPKLVAHALERAAATMFQQTAAANRDASAQKLWDLMQRRPYSTAQVLSQHARFTSATMKRDETVEEFAERLRELACGLPETTTDGVLLQRQRDGLPSSLKVSALAVSGEFDEVVSQVGQIADVMAAASPRREPVNMIGGCCEKHASVSLT